MPDNLKPTETPQDAAVAAMLAKVDAGLEAIRKKAVADFDAKFDAEIKKRLEPNRDVVRAISDDAPSEKAPALTALRLTDPRQHLYERMKRLDPAMAVYRSPDSDHWAADWIRGMTTGDMARVQRALGEIEKIYGRATITEGTTTATSGLSQGEGGFLIPLPLAGSISLALNRVAKIRSLASVYQSVAKTLRVPTSAAATAYMVAEGATATQGEPDLSSVLLDKKKMQCQFGVGKETLRDSAFDLAGFFTERAGSAMGQLEDVEICTAASTPTVGGVLAVTELSEASSTVLTYADLVTLWYTIPEQYHPNATWLCGGVVGGLLSRLMISGGVAPALSPANPSVTIGDGAHVQGYIFGRPVVIVPFPSGKLVCADVRRGYAILDDGGIEVESSMHAGWSTDTVLWKFTRRFDGIALGADFGRQFTGLASIA